MVLETNYEMTVVCCVLGVTCIILFGVTSV
jgi:hypothetical protein